MQQRTAAVDLKQPRGTEEQGVRGGTSGELVGLLLCNRPVTLEFRLPHFMLGAGALDSYWLCEGHLQMG